MNLGKTHLQVEKISIGPVIEKIIPVYPKKNVFEFREVCKRIQFQTIFAYQASKVSRNIIEFLQVGNI